MTKKIKDHNVDSNSWRKSSSIRSHKKSQDRTQITSKGKCVLPRPIPIYTKDFPDTLK